MVLLLLQKSMCHCFTPENSIDFISEEEVFLELSSTGASRKEEHPIELNPDVTILKSSRFISTKEIMLLHCILHIPTL